MSICRLLTEPVKIALAVVWVILAIAFIVTCLAVGFLIRSAATWALS
jgi:preprotein translocase subunit SecG